MRRHSVLLFRPCGCESRILNEFNPTNPSGILHSLFAAITNKRVSVLLGHKKSAHLESLDPLSARDTTSSEIRPSHCQLFSLQFNNHSLSTDRRKAEDCRVRSYRLTFLYFPKHIKTIHLFEKCRFQSSELERAHSDSAASASFEPTQTASQGEHCTVSQDGQGC